MLNKFTTQKRKLIAIVATVAILVLSVAGGAAYWYFSQVSAPAQPEAVEDIQLDNTAEAAKLRTQISQTTNAAEKAKLYAELTKSEGGAGNIEAAATAAGQAAQLNPVVDNFAIAGAYYARLDDNAKAIEYYQKALALLPKTDDPTLNNDYNYYVGQIIKLGGTVQ